MIKHKVEGVLTKKQWGNSRFFTKQANYREREM